MKADVIAVAGVAGSGKTTVGRDLAARLGVNFLDADDYHSPENRARMNAGIALTDEERRPWLATLAPIVLAALAAKKPTVLACSALSRATRDALRVGSGVVFFLIDVPEDEVVRRLQARQGHFFNPVLVRSQFDALELPTDEQDATIIDGNRPVEEIVEDVALSLIGRMDA